MLFNIIQELMLLIGLILNNILIMREILKILFQVQLFSNISHVKTLKKAKVYLIKKMILMFGV